MTCSVNMLGYKIPYCLSRRKILLSIASQPKVVVLITLTKYNITILIVTTQNLEMVETFVGIPYI
jgi:hypothetical protein